MEVVGQQGDRFMVMTRKDGLFPMGYMVDLEVNEVSEEVNLWKFIKSGYWEEPKISIKKEQEIIALAEEKQNG